MGNLLKLLLRYHGFILFLLLESIAFVLLSHNSYYQQTQLFSAIQTVQSYCYDVLEDVTSYVSLKKENERLVNENARLRNMLDHYQNVDTMRKYDAIDINVYQSNIFHTKMLIKEVDLQNYLFNIDIYELLPKTRLQITNSLRQEMIEIFSGSNIY